MAHEEFDLSELLDAVRAGGDIDVIRRSVEMVLQALIDAEATEVIGARPHERTDTRTNQRNGTRPRLLSTKAGDVELAIPKVRHGSFFPSVLKRRRRIDRALWLQRDWFQPDYAGRPWALWTANSALRTEASEEPVRWVVVQP